MKRNFFLFLSLIGAKVSPSMGSIVVSNLDNPDPLSIMYVGTIGTQPKIAQSFTTGAVPSRLNSISIPVYIFSGTPTVFSPVVFADEGGKPSGMAVEALPDYTCTADPGVRTILLLPASGKTLLEANTTYWFSLSSPRSASWFQTTFGDEASDAGWTLGDDEWSYGYTSTWVKGGQNRPMRLAVDATILPEPGIAGLVPMLLLLPRRRR